MNKFQIKIKYEAIIKVYDKKELLKYIKLIFKERLTKLLKMFK